MNFFSVNGPPIDPFLGTLKARCDLRKDRQQAETLVPLASYYLDIKKKNGKFNECVKNEVGIYLKF